MADHYGHHNASPESGNLSDEESGGHHGGGQDSLLREQDRFLPIANVSRIMKRALPGNGKISKEAKETVQECASEFISFITGEASDKCQKEKRKTVNGDDLLWAMTTLGFEDYVEPLKVYLQKYREMEGEKASMAWQGEQMLTKEGSSGGLMSVSVGLNGSGVGTLQTMQHAYMQPSGPFMYPQYQPLASYPMSLPSGGTTGNSGGQM